MSSTNEQKYSATNPQPAQPQRTIFNNWDEVEAYFSKRGYGFFYNCDFSKLDFSQKEAEQFFSRLGAYDSSCTWPEKIAPRMQHYLDAGKNPGLGVHHAQFTGKNVHIAIVDLPSCLNHPEFVGKIASYSIHLPKEQLNTPLATVSEMHGPCVISIAVGKTCGTAPDATMHYWATRFNPSYGLYRLECLKEILAYNQHASEEEKIRCLSCSWGRREDPEFEERTKLFEEIEKSGCMVFGGFYEHLQGRTHDGLSRNLNADLNSPQSYTPDSPVPANRLLIPQNNRTQASFTGGYLYNERGGTSWRYPYLSGVVTCAIEANPDIVKEENWQSKVWDALLETAIPVSKEKNANRIIQPIAFVDYIANKKYLEKDNKLEDQNSVQIQQAITSRSTGR